MEPLCDGSGQWPVGFNHCPVCGVIVQVLVDFDDLKVGNHEPPNFTFAKRHWWEKA